MDGDNYTYTITEIGFMPTRAQWEKHLAEREQMAAKIAEQAATIARLEAELKTANKLAAF